MKLLTYTYTVLQYSHRPFVGERINLGVFVCSTEGNFVGCKIEHKYEHLSHIFNGFDSNQFFHVINRIRNTVEKFQRDFERGHAAPNLFSKQDLAMSNILNVESMQDIVDAIFPQNDLSYQFTEVCGGLTGNPERELESLFDLYIASQRPAARLIRSRSDADVWTDFSKSFSPDLKGALHPKRFDNDRIEIEFQHTFLNGKWNILQPVSLDYVEADQVLKKAQQLCGLGHALELQTDVGCLYLLVGAPHSVSARKAYTKAENLINAMPLKKKIVREDEAKEQGQEIEAYMRKNNVLQ